MHSSVTLQCLTDKVDKNKQKQLQLQHTIIA